MRITHILAICVVCFGLMGASITSPAFAQGGGVVIGEDVGIRVPLSETQKPEVVPGRVYKDNSNLPWETDLAEFDLIVKNAAVTNQINDLVQGIGLRAQTGYKLVAVTLEGTSLRACRFPVLTSEFGAVFTASDGTPRVYHSAAVEGMGDGAFWTVTPATDSSAMRKMSVESAGDFTFKVAFVIPSYVNSFEVRYPASTPSMATIR